MPGRGQRNAGARPARRGTSALLAAAVTLPAVGIAGPVIADRYHATRNVRVPLLAAGVAIRPDGRLTDATGRDSMLPGSRVLRPSDPAALPAAERLAAAQRAWLAEGEVPGAGTPWAGMVADALLDVHTLTGDVPGGSPGSTVAAWSPKWRYVWPRDAAFVAVALARTGHASDAVQVLDFLATVQAADGIFEARYLPAADGPGDVPDGRGVQLDGTGWTLWACEQVRLALPPAERAAYLARVRPLVDRSTDASLRLVDNEDALPGPSADYWETREEVTTLGTAAPLATGLEAAAALQEGLGDPARAMAARAAAGRLRAAIHARFGPDGYPRHLDGTRRDAAVAFLLPPFAASADPAVTRAWQAAAEELARPAGGLAPGAGWKNDGVSWTPETALFALAAASTGDRARAAAWLDWLEAHRTPLGALPEKVLSNGRPAGPAPLAWTAAIVVLAVAALDHPNGAAT